MRKNGTPHTYYASTAANRAQSTSNLRSPSSTPIPHRSYGNRPRHSSSRSRPSPSALGSRCSTCAPDTSRQSPTTACNTPCAISHYTRRQSTPSAASASTPSCSLSTLPPDPGSFCLRRAILTKLRTIVTKNVNWHVKEMYKLQYPRHLCLRH